MPSGVEPNYVNPPSEGWKVINSTAITLAFAIVLVILRLFVKFTKTHAPGWDDSGDIIYVFGVMFAKLSILILYYRIFGIDRKFRYACLFIIVIVVGYCTSCGLAKIFICSPVKAGWAKHYKGPKHCADHIKIDFVLGWFSIFTDFAIFLMPAPMLWKLHLARYKKLGLSIVFMFGAFACAMSIARQAFLYAGHDTKDSLVWNIIVFTLELNIGIICGCLPVIQPLLKQIPISKYLPSSLLSYFASYKSKGSYRDNKIYVKRSNTTDPSRTEDDIELREDKNPMVKDAGYPTKDSDENLQHHHESHGGILRTDRFDVHSDENTTTLKLLARLSNVLAPILFVVNLPEHLREDRQDPFEQVTAFERARNNAGEPSKSSIKIARSTVLAIRATTVWRLRSRQTIYAAGTDLQLFLAKHYQQLKKDGLPRNSPTKLAAHVVCVMIKSSLSGGQCEIYYWGRRKQRLRAGGTSPRD
ncbi:MAG: hypothetical protein Q9218_005663 [Villophora microphyllina]